MTRKLGDQITNSPILNRARRRFETPQHNCSSREFAIQLPSQSAPTILFLKTRVGFVTLKKIGHPVFYKKQGAKNQGNCYSKREEAAWSLLFLNNNDRFAKSRVPDISKVPDPKKISGRPDKLE